MLQCPRCGQTARGNFCNHCGAELAQRSCVSCGTALTSGAQFCHGCGNRVGGSGRLAVPIPWIVAGAAVLVLFFVVVTRLVLRNDATVGTVASSDAAAATADISQMSPRERADRLFDRVMRANEQGNTQEVQFFAPMALQAYSMLGGLDNDARYHVGLIHAANGEPQAALAQADSLESSSPDHLFVPMLRASVYRAQQDAASLREAYERFLAVYSAGMATGSTEYEQHRRAIDAFVAEARSATGDK